MPAARGPISSGPELAEVPISHHSGKARLALIEDAAPMSNKQQGEVPPGLLAQAAVVEGRHDCLTRPGSRDDQVLVPVVALALAREVIQHPLLMTKRAYIKSRE